ncbi:exodeoxyribonuclease V subunit gamma, partial [Myxococcota bacterium]|nr:exodeoxyribonuclease V subunit gamma [Myxococcota bacterium]
MSLRIVFSGDTQVLASRLADDLRSDPGQASILETTRILCPNRNLELWLRKRLAELAGVSVNLEFPYLERGLWELVGIVGVARGVVTPDAAGRPAVRESDAVVTRSRVAAVLMKQALAGDAGSPIVSYCLSGGGLSDQGFAVRLWQVAGRLADLFREYEFSRTTMVREWLAGRDLPGASDVALEQARIYRMVCGSDPSGEPCGGQPG